nr:magnesium chelatase subunit D [Sphingomonas yantingensis]
MGAAAPDAHRDALIAARLCTIDPRLGGIVLKGGEILREAVLADLREGLGPERRIPVNVDDDRLLGGIDLTATLAAGRPVRRDGLLAEAAGGFVVLPMAERLSEAVAGRIAAAIDTGDARFVTIAFDDGVEADARPPAALMERLAFHIDLTEARPGAALSPVTVADHAEDTPGAIDALVTTAAALGIASARAPRFAMLAARAAARADGRTQVTDADLALAARLVLAPRATQWPAEPEGAEAPPPPPEPGDGQDETASDTPPLDDLVLAAVLAALPPDLLAQVAAGKSRQRARANGAGERRLGHARGRPLGARAGMPGGGKRLSLIDTLRAAAPWQRLRGRGGRVLIRRDDLRIRRFEARAEALTIFAVDASGSSALARLAEAKGAVELLLAEAYVKRAEVALIAFRGTGAEPLLPPTRSLTRARRSLADLPGGGGTPLAAGLNAARELAESARARGRTPFIVVLTDGRANIAADGGTVRAIAESDAASAARAIGVAGIAAAFVDISARPRPEGAMLAAAMRARYLALPRADATAMHAAISAVQAA